MNHMTPPNKLAVAQILPPCIRTLLVLLTAAQLSACVRSPSSDFFVPLPRTLEQTEARCHVPKQSCIQLLDVQVPPSLAQNEMTIPEYNHKLTVWEFERWGASFDEVITTLFLQLLSEQIPPGLLIPPSDPLRRRCETQLLIELRTLFRDSEKTVHAWFVWHVTEGAARAEAKSLQLLLRSPQPVNSGTELAASISGMAEEVVQAVCRSSSTLEK